MHLMRAESPGPSVGKISSKIRDTAKILYAMYLVLTVVQTILLRLVGLPWYDALITAFGAFVILCACHALDGLSIAESED